MPTRQILDCCAIAMMGQLSAAAKTNRVNSRRFVLVIEHDIDRVFAFADDITVMHNGAVLAAGKPAEACAHPQVQSVYLGTGRRISSARAPPGTAKAHDIRMATPPPKLF